MKTLGVILIVVGISMAMLGYEQYGNIDCFSHAMVGVHHLALDVKKHYYKS